MLFHHIYSKEYGKKKKMKDKKRGSRISKQAIERGIHGQVKKDDNDNGDKTFKIGL